MFGWFKKRKGLTGKGRMKPGKAKNYLKARVHLHKTNRDLISGMAALKRKVL